MSKNLNQQLIENQDVINFDLKIKNKLDENEPLKIKNKKMTIGANQILEEIDQQLVGVDLSNEKIVELELNISNNINVFGNSIEPGKYIFSFRINNLEKNKNVDNIEKTINLEKEELDIIKELLNNKNNHEKIEANKIDQSQFNNNDSELNDLKEKELNDLKELNNLLKEKIEKLEEEKSISENAFKIKVEEIGKNAIEKVEKIKEEIKAKAKEEIESKTKFATQKLIENLIGPINNLDIVIEMGSNNDNSAIAGYVKGFKMLLSQIMSTLEANGVKTINPNVGDEYKPEIHEAQDVIESNEFKKDQIIKTISKGYTLNERVIKPAVVVVSK